MSDTLPSLMPLPARQIDEREIVDALARALCGRTAPRRVTAVDRQASPEEGLALVAAFLEIDDPTLRQALLDAVALLAAPYDQGA